MAEIRKVEAFKRKTKKTEYFNGENLVESNYYICECQNCEKTKFWSG